MSSLSSALLPGDPFGSESSANATRAQSQSAAAALEELQRQFDIQQGAVQPFRDIALPGLGEASRLAGVMGDPQQRNAIARMLPTPGQEFREAEGERRILQDASARGGLGGGNVLRQLQDFGIGSGRAQVEDQFNRLSGLAGTAQTATGQLGQIGQQFSSGVSDQLTNRANAIASGEAAQQQAKSNLISTGVGLLGLITSDEAMKHDITEVTDEQLYNALMEIEIKAWKYNGSDEVNIGPMYQNSPDIIKEPGMKALNLHNELWMMAGAMRHMMRVIENG